MNHDAWDVADAAMTHLENIMAIIDNEKLATVESALQKIVKPRFELLASATGSGNELLQQSMQRFLIAS